MKFLLVGGVVLGFVNAAFAFAHDDWSGVAGWFASACYSASALTLFMRYEAVRQAVGRADER